MKSLRPLIAGSAFALIAAAPIAHAAVGDVYTASNLGVTFTFTQTDPDTLKFELQGKLNLDPNWTAARYLAAFDLKDLGITFSTNSGPQPRGQTGVANGPGAVNLGGSNTQASASAVDCVATGTPPGGICFDVNDQFASLGTNPGDTFHLTYIIDFSHALNI